MYVMVSILLNTKHQVSDSVVIKLIQLINMVVILYALKFSWDKTFTVFVVWKAIHE